MRIILALIAAAAVIVITGCSSSQPAGDAAACQYFKQWVGYGGATSQFGNFTNLLDAAVKAASAVPSSDAKAIANGLPQPPAGDHAAQMMWDLNNVQADAEGDINPPDGWSQEVAAVTVDCDNKL